MNNSIAKKHRNEFPVFGDVVANFFDDHFYGLNKSTNRLSTPKVNIAESDKNYSIQLASPGMAKENFEIDLKENILTISASSTTEKEKENLKYSVREFNYSDFKRTFRLPKNAASDKIKANYFDGILEVNIPKKELKKKEIKKIEIS